MTSEETQNIMATFSDTYYPVSNTAVGTTIQNGDEIPNTATSLA